MNRRLALVILAIAGPTAAIAQQPYPTTSLNRGLGFPVPPLSNGQVAPRQSLGGGQALQSSSIPFRGQRDRFSTSNANGSQPAPYGSTSGTDYSARGFVPRGPNTPPPRPVEPPASLYEPAQTMARVGDEVIFRGELEGDVNLMLAPVLAKLPPEQVRQNRTQIMADRERLVQQLLKSAVDRKLLYLDFVRSIPADKMKEAMDNIQSRTGEAFEEGLFKMVARIEGGNEEEFATLSRQNPRLFRLAMVMNEFNISSIPQLVDFLKEHQSSYADQRKAFAERILGQQRMRDQVKLRPEVTYDEMMRHYERNPEAFEVAARVRWEQITVRFSRHSSRFDAGQKIADLGNELALGGTQFQALAKRESDGAKAEEGGYHDWMDWGNLELSREIHDALFSIPVGRLSNIVEDGEGLHIVRVIEREDAHMIPFTEAQSTIKTKLLNEKRNKSLDEYLSKVRDRTPVWTIYDEEAKRRMANPASANRPFPR